MTVLDHLEEVRQWFPQIRTMAMADGDLSIDTKTSRTDLVTNVDREVEDFLTEQITHLNPEAVILGEEAEDKDVDVHADHLWVIDPIDGTTNFVKQGKNYGTLLAYFEKDEPLLAYVYNIYRDELYEAVRGRGITLNGKPLNAPLNLGLQDSLIGLPFDQMRSHPALNRLCDGAFGVRNYGASSIDGIAVVDGSYGAFINPHGGPWDYAPYFLFAEEAGLHFSAFDGKPARLDAPNGFILSTKACWEDIKDWMMI